MSDIYEGVVCYQDGWHMSVDEDDAPDKRLVLEDRFLAADGSVYDGEAVVSEGNWVTPSGDPLTVDARYRFATDADTRSWHERKHKKFATIELGAE